MDRQRTDLVTGEVIIDPPIRPFTEWLQERPKTLDEISEGLWDLIQRVEETRKKGKITLTVMVEPMPKSDGHVLVVRDNIALTLPEFDREPAIAYIDKNGNLSRSDPNQPELSGLRSLPENEKKQLKEAV